MSLVCVAWLHSDREDGKVRPHHRLHPHQLWLHKIWNQPKGWAPHVVSLSWDSGSIEPDYRRTETQSITHQPSRQLHLPNNTLSRCSQSRLIAANWLICLKLFLTSIPFFSPSFLLLFLSQSHALHHCLVSVSHSPFYRNREKKEAEGDKKKFPEWSYSKVVHVRLTHSQGSILLSIVIGWSLLRWFFII